MHLIFQDRFWVVRIPFGSMVIIIVIIKAKSSEAVDYREVDPHHRTNVLVMTLNSLMVMLQFESFGECGVLLHFTKVYSDLGW